ncbi:L-fuco-beta-pyranose dehydrogenase [Minicystis rosea]|nr:L-fuco-beta-pyranose dehydrogenase [Minicystis rosea]
MMIEPRKPGEPVAVALGCMNFGKRTPAAESERIIARALERGITFFDTANIYSDGESEKIVGRALRSARDRVTIATKVGAARVQGKPEGLSRARILTAIDESLARLGIDHVDVYYLHVPDHVTPIVESLAAMEEIRAAGKIGAMGVSNYAAWQILEMMAVAERGSGPRPVISQVMYNLLIRQIEIEYVAFTKEHPIHNTIYNPLAGGLLSGRHVRTGETEKGSRFDKNRMYQGRYWSDRFFDLVDAYRAVASDGGMSLVELSYAWLAGQPHVSSILVGPSSIEHLDAALDGCQKALSVETRKRIDEIHRAYQGTDASYVR